MYRYELYKKRLGEWKIVDTYDSMNLIAIYLGKNRKMPYNIVKGTTPYKNIYKINKINNPDYVESRYREKKRLGLYVPRKKRPSGLTYKKRKKIQPDKSLIFKKNVTVVWFTYNDQ